jgi:FAD/FMN-containing dehydrogenase
MAAEVAVSREVIDALRTVVGSDGLIESPEERAAYECDAYTIERHVPGLVVLPVSVEEGWRWCDCAPGTG